MRKRLKEGTIQELFGQFDVTYIAEMEADLAEKVRKLDQFLFYGLKYKDLQSLAFKCAESGKLNYKFNKTTQLAGKKWVSLFCKRHNLAIRQPEKVSAA